MGKPILLLDIDGTLNPMVNRLPLHVWPAGQWREDDVADDHGLLWHVQTALPVINFLRNVHRFGLADIMWHTTWQQSALRYARATGLPRFPVIPAQPHGPMRRSGNWKLAAVDDLAERGLEIIWVDDDSTRILGYQPEWAIAPHPEEGLRLDDLRRIAWRLDSSLEVIGMDTPRP